MLSYPESLNSPIKIRNFADMDSAFELPIHISYRPPSWLVVALIISHFGAIICVFYIPVPFWIKAATSLAVIVCLLRSLSGYWRYKYTLPAIQLIFNSSDEWTLIDDQGDRPVRLQQGAYVRPGLLVLRFQDNGRRHSFILTPATVDGDILRRLRVRLRFVNRG